MLSKNRLEKLEKRYTSHTDAVPDVTVNVIGMDGTIKKSFTVKKGELCKRLG